MKKQFPVFKTSILLILFLLNLPISNIVAQNILDTDGDGVEDTVDLDDDNDGLLDVYENDKCTSESGNDCDFDADGIPNRLDLDDDNDGIPTVIELGLLDDDKDATLYGTNWVDSNVDGVDDTFGGINNPLDSDSDGSPDYLDLDSDNDTIFDAFEYDGLGDIDISGDGLGDGDDVSTSVNDDEKDGDGILGIIDGNDADVDANDFGSEAYANPKDSDSDGIPDYLDVDSDNDGIFDIEETIYNELIEHTNGVVSATEDIDKDGIIDSFDTDTVKLGSPRNLSSSYSLYFDGRNDYIEEIINENETLINGQQEVTLMAWIKLDSTFSNTGTILGQNKFWIRINASQRFSSTINNKYPLTASAGTELSLNKWTHVAAIYNANDTDETLKLYINGEKVASRNSNIQGGIENSTNTNFRIGKKPANTTTGNEDLFKGEIDEVRVFRIALSENEIQKMIYQELDEDNNFNFGKIIPLEISSNLGSSLLRYYRMDIYKDAVIDNLTTTEIDTSGAKMYNMNHIYHQTAPLPYETIADGDWSTSKTWKYGKVWDISNKKDKINDCAIVHIKHNLSTSNTQAALGLLIDSGADFSVKPSVGLYNNWYLKLDGSVDLEGESQLIQSNESILDSNSAGFIEKDQQGTASSYNYNYWSSSVNSGNGKYTIGKVLLDGSKPDEIEGYPKNINFQPNYNAADNGLNQPIIISTYWLWKFNGLSDDYNSWISLNGNSELLPGEGFTMKGTSGTSSITDLQNYVFRGLPNNGNIKLNITLGNDRLVGNPYPSAIDANEFILDNISDNGGRASSNIFNGAIYFWHHFAGKTHYLSEYEGGYATYNLIGGVQAYATDERINATGGGGLIEPERYIPVNQGFFIITSLDESLTGITTVTGGDILFKNSQRIFKVEGITGSNEGSVFLKPNQKTKAKGLNETEFQTNQKIWLQFDSSNGYHRQLLVGVNENATDQFDLGFDAPLIDKNSEDMFWLIDNAEFVIQGVENFNKNKEIPLAVVVEEKGAVKIKVDKIQNISESTEIYIKDTLSSETYQINKQSFEIELEAGEYLDRFSLVFQPRLKTLEEIKLEQGFSIFTHKSQYAVQVKKIIDVEILSINLYNIYGRMVQTWEGDLGGRHLFLPIRKTTTGVYIVQLNTANGTFEKKIIIE